MTPSEMKEEVQKIFDHKIKLRGSPGAVQFFLTYFSDEPLNHEDEAKFNPRMIHFFADELEKHLSNKNSTEEILSSDAVINSYKEAAKLYLTGVIEELDGMSEIKDRAKIKSIMENMRGYPTPFIEDQLKAHLLEKKGPEEVKAISDLFANMQQLGMIVTAGKGQGSYKRVSRLLREALGMKINASINSKLR